MPPGQSLRYGAELDGQWVALLAFGAASLHLKAREKWLGWSPRQRARRLGLVVNHCRFLVLPERQRFPNLASRGLGLCLRRLCQDWQERWQHPVLVLKKVNPLPGVRITAAAWHCRSGCLSSRRDNRTSVAWPKPT